jgi:hypothetical protein
MFLMLEDVTKLIWGANPYYVSEPYALFGNIDVGSQSYVGYDLMLVVLAVLVGGRAGVAVGKEGQRRCHNPGFHDSRYFF